MGGIDVVVSFGTVGPVGGWVFGAVSGVTGLLSVRGVPGFDPTELLPEGVVDGGTTIVSPLGPMTVTGGVVVVVEEVSEAAAGPEVGVTPFWAGGGIVADVDSAVRSALDLRIGPSAVVWMSAT